MALSNFLFQYRYIDGWRSSILTINFRIGYSLSRQCLSIYQERLLPLVDNSNPDQPPVPSANNYPIYIHYCSSWDAIDVLDGAH